MPRIRDSTIQAHRRQVENAILDAWGSLIEDHSYAEITMAMVAERAGIARNTIYGYYPDKGHLMLAHLEREVSRFLDAVTAAVDEAVGAVARLRVVFEHHAHYFATHAGSRHEIGEVMGPEGYRQFMAHFTPLHKLVRRIVREGKYEGVFRDVDPEAVTPLILATIAVYRVPLATGEIAPEQAAANALDFTLHGLVAHARPSRED
ncbi:MAG TPA: TetR/AcrR family transcriptional regulator [Thermomicrobiales bacterium]